MSVYQFVSSYLLVHCYYNDPSTSITLFNPFTAIPSIILFDSITAIPQFHVT